jgi:hypothetical protein
VIEQPGAAIGASAYCPVSGVVFEVKADSPHHDVHGKTVYFCCPGCANYFAGNREDVIAKRQLARTGEAAR